MPHPHRLGSGLFCDGHHSPLLHAEPLRRMLIGGVLLSLLQVYFPSTERSEISKIAFMASLGLTMPDTATGRGAAI